MAKTKIMDIVAAKNPSIVHDMLAMRDQGKSYYAISRYVSIAFGFDVSHMSVRQWFLDREKAHDEPVA